MGGLRLPLTFMEKKDAPRLKQFLGTMMRASVGPMPMKELVALVRDMEWLADVAEQLTKEPKTETEGIKIVSSEPIDGPKKPRSKKAKTKV